MDRVPLHVLGFNFRDEGQIETLEDPARREIAGRIFPHTIWIDSVPSHISRYLVTPPQRIREVERREDRDGEMTVREIDTPKGKLRAVTRRDRRTLTVWTVKYPVEDMEDIRKIISVPWELPEDLAPPGDLSPDVEGRRVVYTHILALRLRGRDDALPGLPAPLRHRAQPRPRAYGGVQEEGPLGLRCNSFPAGDRRGLDGGM